MFSKKFPSFLESESEPKSAGNAFFHVIPVPCEKTVSYGKGTANGPSAILNASNQLESFDGYQNNSAVALERWTDSNPSDRYPRANASLAANIPGA